MSHEASVNLNQQKIIIIIYEVINDARSSLPNEHSLDEILT